MLLTCSKFQLFQVEVALVYLCTVDENREDLRWLVGSFAHHDAQSLPCKKSKLAPNTSSASQMSSVYKQYDLLSVPFWRLSHRDCFKCSMPLKSPEKEILTLAGSRNKLRPAGSTVFYY